MSCDTGPAESGVRTARPPGRRWRAPRPGWPDLLPIALLALAAGLLATGLLPTERAAAALWRTAPLLIFLVAVLVLAELAARAEVFDVLAVRMAIAGRGSYPALFALSVGLAAVTTMILNLDTTAVLLTPVMLAVAVRAGIATLPLAMTTVWLANTASLLLPISNLTNLLAADRVDLSPLGFAERMAVPQAAALLATAGCLWIFYWRRGLRDERRYAPPTRHRPRDPVLFRVAAVTCGCFAAGVLAGVPIEIVAVAAALALVAAFAARDRAGLRGGLVSWRLLGSVTGLFLVVEAISRHGLLTEMAKLIGPDGGPAGIWRAAATGAGLSNLVNNLPAYLAGEAVVPAGNHDQLLGLLIGTNVGPLVLPWASLATLLWLQRCRAAGVRIHWPRFVATGAVTAVVVLSAAVGALLATG
ncbi:ArsB/NhaD family transporter [Solwaraspora sp. WMMD1047]|uniref:SLC13 family permease n=1 Tax=Solwaraspora sp. WMMD1047 TaxID=3016102 RepID=UPI0024179862|nr:SLC13 family permease [Solwaraspora sp. WMMD1047]MDG4832458.1 ArsB/NhaD family transporter [Solwaraspora sp. WMMD1047]